MIIPELKHRTWAEINLAHAEYNFKQIRRNTSSKIAKDLVRTEVEGWIFIWDGCREII